MNVFAISWWEKKQKQKADHKMWTKIYSKSNRVRRRNNAKLNSQLILITNEFKYFRYDKDKR